MFDDEADAVCCPSNHGWFTNAETRLIERCDDCRQFPHDDAAAELVRSTVTNCVECAAAFGSRSALNPSLCEGCLCVD